VKISIDAEACTGHGRCYSLAPALFASDDDWAGRVIAAEVPPHLADVSRLVVANCPEHAIPLDD
jgi:ferredoxin